MILTQFLSVSTLLTASAVASLLLEGGTIISFDENNQQLRIIRNGSILIENNRIVELFEGPVTNLANNTERIDVKDKIISPGFINTHQHSWQTAFKTLGSNTTLADYFQKFSEYSPASVHFTPDDVYLGQLTGALELLNEGTTTILEHAHGDFSVEGTFKIANASYESGLRTYFAMAIHELSNNYSVDIQLEVLQTLAQDNRFIDSDSIMKIGLAYDSFWDPAKASLVDRMWNITQDNNLSVVTSHYLGGPWGNNNDPVTLNRYGWLNTSIPVVFGHASFIDSTNADLLRQTNQYISTTPESELHYGHDHPYIHLIQDQASIGLDTHFTFGSSMVWQARLWLQSLRLQNFAETLNRWEIPINSPMSVSQAFHLITRAGAQSLRNLDIGVIREGAKADLVVFDTSSPNMLGWKDPIAAIILHSSPGDVQHVIVDGKFVKRDGKLTYANYADLRRRFTDSATRIQDIWAGLEWPSLEEKFENLSYYAQTQQIDTQRGEGTGY